MEIINAQPFAAKQGPVYPTIQESWGALGWYLLLVVLLVLLMLLPAKAIGYSAEPGKTSIVLALTVVANASLVWWLRRRAGAERWLSIQWRWPRRPWVALGLLPVLVPALAIVLSAQRFLHLPHWSAGKSLAVLASHPLLAVVFGCLLGPATEEVLFRGALLPGLLRNYRPAVAIGQSALLFGLFHLNPAQALNAFLMGLLLGWLYYRSHSLWLCICLHGLYNALALWANNNAGLVQRQLPALMHQPGYALLWLGAALLLAASLVTLSRSQGPKKSLAASSPRAASG